ncbi:MAG TPA: peptidoglycan DD-metalloendopeptidase family protein [Polyangiaceae bacterium]
MPPRAKYSQLSARFLVLGCCVVGSTMADPLRLAPTQYEPGQNTHEQYQQALPSPLPAAHRADSLVSTILRDQQAVHTELTKIDFRLRQVRLRSIARGRAFVRMTRAGLLPASAGVESLIEHASSVESLRRALDRDLLLEQDLTALKARLLKKNGELDERLRAMQAERQLMESNRVALEAARDRALAFERAFVDSEPSPHTAIYGAGVGPADPVAVPSGFAALRGRLPFPLAGRAEVRPAKRRAASGPALEMLAPPGAAVHAVYGGTVAFADEYADYGKSIIIDHGDGYFTVSANLASIEVKVGDDVGSGSRLATLSPGSSQTALYFEIRRGTDTLDPAEWFGI